MDQATGKVKVHKVICAVDCGPAVYPDAITAQMEGGVVMALSVAFYERINFDGFVKSPKTANFQVSHLIISIGYEIKIREF